LSKVKLIRNSLSGTVQVLLTAILTLLSVPVFINTLGLELYGAFSVVTVVGNLNFIVNFGLNSALLVYVAKQGKCRESDLDIAVTRTLLVFLIFVISIIVFLLGRVIIKDILKIPDGYLKESTTLFYLLIISNAVLLLGQINTAILDALQKIHITNACQFIYSLIYWVGIITVVKMGGRLPEVGLMALSASIIWFIILSIISRKTWGKSDIKGFWHEFLRVAKKQITFGIKIYMTGLIGFLFEPLSKLLLSNFIGLNAVGLYEIGLKVKGQLYSIFSKALYPLVPFIAHFENKKILKARLFDLSKILVLIAIPVSITLAFTLTILVKLWIGSENYIDASIFVISQTMMVLLFSFPIVPIYQFLIATNKAEKNILIQLLNVIVNLVLFFGLFRTYGMYTIIISNLGGYLASFALGNYYQKLFLGAKYFDERFYYLKMFILGLICTITCLGISHFIGHSLLDLIIYPSVIIGVFVLFTRIFRLITEGELNFYFASMLNLRLFLKRIFIVQGKAS